MGKLALIGGHSILGSDTSSWGTINSPGNTNTINNAPGPNDIYQVPQDIRYFLTGIERKRTNGQLTLQYRPVDSVTATLDYTWRNGYRDGYPLFSAGAGNGGTSPQLVEQPQISWRKLTEEALAALPGQRITVDVDGRIVRQEASPE